MDKELIVKGIRDPEIARRIFRAIEDDPGELRLVSSSKDVEWAQDFDFAVYEDCGKNLHTLAWYPSPSPELCLGITRGVAYEYMCRAYGGWPRWLQVSFVAIAEDVLYDEPIIRERVTCNGERLDIDFAKGAIMQVGMAMEIIKMGE